MNIYDRMIDILSNARVNEAYKPYDRHSYAWTYGKRPGRSPDTMGDVWNRTQDYDKAMLRRDRINRMLRLRIKTGNPYGGTSPYGDAPSKVAVKFGQFRRGLSKFGRKLGFGKPEHQGLKMKTNENRVNLYGRIIYILVESKLTQYLGEKPARKVGPMDTADNKLASMAVRSAQAKRLLRFRDGLGGKFRRDIRNAQAKVRIQQNPTAPISQGEKAKRRKP